MRADLTNKTSYLSSMGRSAFDKLFFVPIVSPNLIVDYGCADGVMLAAISEFYPDAKLVGYDIDTDMIAIAKARNLPNCTFTSNWQEVEEIFRNTDGERAIILSSIVHEMYSYLSMREVNEFWAHVFEFDTVILRDMMSSQSVDRPSDMTDVINIRRKYTAQVRDFEAIWGSIERNKNLVHFLLKYRWLDNWDREVRENYFPLTIEEFMVKIPAGYEVIYWEHFALHYLKNKMLEETGVVLKDCTHLKAILHKRK